MKKFFLSLGSLMFFNKQHQRVRGGAIWLFTNLLLVAGIIFSLEIILIFLGIGDIFLPLTRKIWIFLTKIVF